MMQVAFLEKRHPFYRLGGVLITHLHMGHYTGLLQVGMVRIPGWCFHVNPNHLSAVRILTSAPAVQSVDGTPLSFGFLQHNLRLLMETEPWRQLRENKNILLKVFGNLLREEVIGNFSVVPVLVPHRNELSDTLAFRFRPYPPQGAVEGKEGTFYCPDTDGWASHLVFGEDKPKMNSFLRLGAHKVAPELKVNKEIWDRPHIAYSVFVRRAGLLISLLCIRVLPVLLACDSRLIPRSEKPLLD